MSWNDFVVLKNSLSFPFFPSLCYLNSLLWNLSAGNIFMSECCIFSQSIGPLPGQRVSCLSNWKRHLQPEECLHLYLARQKWQCLPLRTASSASVSRGQEALSPITKCTRKFSAQLSQAFRNGLWMFFIFLLLYPTHLLEWFWGFAFFVCACMCVNVCQLFMLQDPRRGTLFVLWFCKTLDTPGTQWNSY